MAIVPPIICSVPDPDNPDPAPSNTNGQSILPGFLNIPKRSRASRPPKASPPPDFQTRLRTGQKFEQHLLGWLRTQYPKAFLLPARSDELNGAPYLYGRDCAVIQPDITVFETQRVTFWECKFRHDVHTCITSNIVRQEVSISLRHWTHYRALWSELCYPFYIVFVIAQQDMVIYGQIGELETAITTIDPRPYRDPGGTVYFDCDRLTYLMSFADFTQL